MMKKALALQGQLRKIKKENLQLYDKLKAKKCEEKEVCPSE